MWMTPRARICELAWIDPLNIFSIIVQLKCYSSLQTLPFTTTHPDPSPDIPEIFTTSWSGWRKN